MRVVFETAAFADAIKQAALVAPTTGSVFDKANGIVLELDPSGTHGWQCLVKSTNIDIFRIEWIDPEEIDGAEPTRWRLPSQLFAKVLSSLPIGTGKTVTIEDGKDGLQTFVRITSGRAKARFNLIQAGMYPEWQIFDPAILTNALDVGARISQVEWAADNGQPPLSGVHFDGQTITATDKYRMASAPLDIPGLAHAVTVPAGLLSQLFRQTGEVKIGIHGGQLLAMPTESVQLRCILFGEDYPDTSRVRRMSYSDEIKVRKTPMLEMLNRVAGYGATDRDAALQLYIGQEEVAAFIVNREMGVMGDAIEIPGQATHDRFQINFTPKNIIDLITNSPSEEVGIAYDRSNPNRLVKVDGGSGFIAWGMPRSQTRPAG